MLKDPTLGFNLYQEIYYIYSCYKQIDSNGILQTGDLELYTVSQIVFACVYTVKVCISVILLWKSHFEDMSCLLFVILIIFIF